MAKLTYLVRPVILGEGRDQMKTSYERNKEIINQFIQIGN